MTKTMVNTTKEYRSRDGKLTRNGFNDAVIENPRIQKQFIKCIRANLNYKRNKKAASNPFGNPLDIIIAKEESEKAFEWLKDEVENLSRLIKKETGLFAFIYWGRGEEFDKDLFLSECDRLIPVKTPQGLYSR